MIEVTYNILQNYLEINSFTINSLNSKTKNNTMFSKTGAFLASGDKNHAHPFN